MLKKAQVSPIGILMGAIGAVAAWIMASQMDAGILMKIISTLLTGGVCYLIAWKIIEGS